MINIDKTYDLILADPPWRYNSKSMKRGGAERHYPTMSDKDILNLNVADLANDSCLLMMWATFPCLELAMQCFPAWGFKYKTQAFTWIKTCKDGVTPATGMGHYTRSNAEICLLGVRGQGTKIIKNRGVNSAIISPRLKHSQKPIEAYEKIEKLVGMDCPKIELFARNKRAGWHSWGNEV
jgi:site-specific DNA-methyltransferase (adenine-specific)